jgi:hypothetical protein
MTAECERDPWTGKKMMVHWGLLEGESGPGSIVPHGAFFVEAEFIINEAVVFLKGRKWKTTKKKVWKMSLKVKQRKKASLFLRFFIKIIPRGRK